ncbi:MAG: hypothetical protein H7Y61_16380 [Rhizobiales bacterium]|nr:hypothetical protein [Rhizobacter sp.]
MRAAPACQVSLRRFGLWRGAVLALTALAVASIVAWASTREGSVTPMLLMASALSTLATVALGVSLARVSPTGLRWDGRAWHLGPATDDTAPGELTVAIDLGPWMLLRFAPTMTEARARVVWLPVQRRGLEAEWHALRCAVYSPRPAPADDPPAGL